MAKYDRKYSDLLNDVLVVVRTSGERTFPKLIHDLLWIGINPKNIKVVNVAPHAAMVAETYKLGMQSDLPLMFALDADIILTPDSFSVLHKSLKRFDGDECIRLLMSVKDKFREVRRAGQHFCYNKWSPHIYRMITEVCDHTMTKPETWSFQTLADEVLPRMVNKTFKRETIKSCIFAHHDYEQYYWRLFNSQRNLTIRTGVRKDYPEKYKKLVDDNPNDPDYLVAYHGVLEGLKQNVKFMREKWLNVYNFFSVESLLSSLNLEEKKPLITPDYIKALDTIGVEHNQGILPSPRKLS